MKLTILFADSKEPVFESGHVISIDEETADALKAAISAAIASGKVAKKFKKKAAKLADVNRQRITTVPPPLAANGSDGTSKTAKKPRGTVLQGGKKTLHDFGVKDGDSLLIKDLGPQVGYSTVFFWEYFGPFVIYPLFFVFPYVFYSKSLVDENPSHCLAQKIATAYWMFHYGKRIYETYFVHKFSHGTMPITNLYKNCSYYWSFAAAVSYFINHPLYTSPSDTRVIVGFVIALVCQYFNYDSHVILTNLRKPGDTGYSIPRGGLFNYCTCANYAAEIYGWFFFNVATQSAMGIIFMTVGALQMMIWAKSKHKRLKTIFDGKNGKEKYPRRWVVLPPLM